MEVLATLMKGEPERSPLQSHIMLLLSSGGQPPGACLGEHSFAEMAPSQARAAACFQPVPFSCSEDYPPARTLRMDHFKEMAPGAFSFLKLFSLATRRFIRKGISKYCVLYCR